MRFTEPAPSVWPALPMISFRKDEHGVVAIEAAIVFAGLIIPCLLGSIYVCQLGAVKMATFYAATASAGVAGRVAQAQDGTHSACETAGRAAFDANRASFFSPDAVVNYTIAWGASNSETVTVLMSLSE